MTALPKPDDLLLDAIDHKNRGVELKVCGVVQGVGFRPFVYRLANEFGLTGTVANSGEGVVIRLAPPLSCLDTFVSAIKETAPPLARITEIEAQPLDHFSGQPGFAILSSETASSAKVLIPPDVAVCEDCLQELFSPANQRYRYPFINCTNCGPRFTIVDSVPYDRPKTSMKVFPMCTLCEQEYHDIANRRFHAQPNACWQCGPRLSWHDNAGQQIICDDPVRETAVALERGSIVAMRGLGGFHLAVDAANEHAVAELRRRKNRKSKPLAVMVKDVASARMICAVSADEEKALLSHERPIVLLPRREGAQLAPSLAPGISHVGVMLPYTPYHHLLFADPHSPSFLVMTSGNSSDEPICTANDEALDKLQTIADFFLLHNRDIVTRIDDSVLRVVHQKKRLMRRARGYVPRDVRFAGRLPEIFSCGAQLKSTFCLARDQEAFLSQHIGDLESEQSLQFYEQSVDHLKNVLEIQPEAVACDLHPDYLSTRFARKQNLPLYRVQHHHAHAVAVMAEHGLMSDTFAVILDGSGYGADNTIWGGEVMLAGLTSFKRLASLDAMALPGGDAAAREPWRMALSALTHAYGEAMLTKFNQVSSLEQIDAHKRAMVIQMMEKGLNCPLTTSCGRLFDAVASLLDLRGYSDFEGQAAMELESLALRCSSADLSQGASPFPVVVAEKKDRLVISTAPMIRTIVDALGQGQERSFVARAFHNWLICSITTVLRELAIRLGRKKVVLGGGCLQNALLLKGLLQSLTAEGFSVYAGESVPVNDGGIALGQAIIGGLRHLQEGHFARED